MTSRLSRRSKCTSPAKASVIRSGSPAAGPFEPPTSGRVEAGLDGPTDARVVCVVGVVGALGARETPGVADGIRPAGCAHAATTTSVATTAASTSAATLRVNAMASR
ncbi:hypothetical protein BA895_14340 [Humibacillus sp. DSM 29435]|nr:hypothetical protein BA895_14340 [Humibacillus sp. DSM 29435]